MSSKSIYLLVAIAAWIAVVAAVRGGGRDQLRDLPQIPVTGSPNTSSQNLHVFANQIGNLEGLMGRERENVLVRFIDVFLKTGWNILSSKEHLSYKNVRLSAAPCTFQCQCELNTLLIGQTPWGLKRIIHNRACTVWKISVFGSVFAKCWIFDLCSVEFQFFDSVFWFNSVRLPEHAPPNW